MTAIQTCLVALALLCAALPAWADSSASSAVSGSLATSVGSISGSVQKSSNSSSNDKKVAGGDYRVVDVAEATDRPASLRLTLRALAPDAAADEFLLVLPREAFERGQLAPGRVVTARVRAYGLEFASARTRETFFLVLNDDWYRELDSRPVVL